jgi:hypothetical protein
MSKRIYEKIKSCRICGSKTLTDVLSLGVQKLTGVFPLPGEDLPESPVIVCKCNHCHLVQLKHTVKLDLMYGETYGYRSSLNQSMVNHLKSISDSIKKLNLLQPGDVIVDIGSNDATFLKFFDASEFTLLGIDPTASKFIECYEGMKVETDFFSEVAYRKHVTDKKAKIITSIACFYDLEDPIEFAQETANILAHDGVWVMEMAYLPAIISNLCFDGYVQEHLEYYSLRDIKYIMDQVDLKIVDVKLTDTNGGSFLVTVCHESNTDYEEFWRLQSMLLQETYLSSKEIHEQFAKDVKEFKERFLDLLQAIKNNGKSVYGLGASTKFNVVLQYCGIGTDLIPAIGEVNSYKFGRVTPGTNIPIVPEKEILDRNPDYLVIGPYHFKESFLKILSDYVEQGGRVIFPLPNLEVIGK